MNKRTSRTRAFTFRTSCCSLLNHFFWRRDRVSTQSQSVIFLCARRSVSRRVVFAKSAHIISYRPAVSERANIANPYDVRGSSALLSTTTEIFHSIFYIYNNCAIIITNHLVTPVNFVSLEFCSAPGNLSLLLYEYR